MKQQIKLLYKICKFYKLPLYEFKKWIKNGGMSYIHNMMCSKFEKNADSKIYFIDNIRIWNDLECMQVKFQHGYVNHVKNIHDVLKTFELIDKKKMIYIDDLKKA